LIAEDIYRSLARSRHLIYACALLKIPEYRTSFELKFMVRSISKACIQ